MTPNRARLLLSPRFAVVVPLVIVAALAGMLISAQKVANTLRNGVLATGEVFTVGPIRGGCAGSLKLQIDGHLVEKGFTWRLSEPEYGDQFRVLIVDPSKDSVALTVGPVPVPPAEG